MWGLDILMTRQPEPNMNVAVFPNGFVILDLFALVQNIKDIDRTCIVIRRGAFKYGAQSVFGFRHREFRDRLLSGRQKALAAV